MVAFLIQLEYGLPAFKMMTRHQTGRFKLSEHAIHGRQTDFFTFIQQGAVNVLCALVTHLGLFHQFENFDPRQGDFKAGFF